MTTFDKYFLRGVGVLVVLWTLWSFLGGPTWLGLLINANQRAAVAEQRLEQLKLGKPTG